MPTYLCHGFRWQRRSIRVYTVVQDLDDVSPEWLIKPTSSRCLLQSFYNLFEFLPYCTPPPPGVGRGYGGGSWDSEESEEDEDGPSDEEHGRVMEVSSGVERDERSQWPERLESLGVIRASRVKEKGKGKSVEEKGEDASSAITAIHVGSESTTRTASRSPSLKLPLQGSRISPKTRQTATSAATTPTTTTIPSATTSRSTSTLGVSSSAGRKSKKTSHSRSSSHSPNRKRDELSAQRWSAVKVLEEYDPNNLDEVSRPYAYVADHVIRVDGAVDIMAEIKRYEEKMQQQQNRVEEITSGGRDTEKRRDENGGRGSPVKKQNRDSAGSRGTAGTAGRDEEYHDALEHLEENTAVKEKEQTWIEQLRDELQRGEEIKWYAVVNGDEERNYSTGFDDEDEEDETEDDYDEKLSSESNYNYGTSYETEDLTISDSLAVHSPTEGGSQAYLSCSAGSRFRTSSRCGRSKSKSRSQSRSHSRTRDRHRNHSRHRDRHGGKRRRPKPTKEQRQHHAQYTLQQELFERNDLRAASSATTSGTATPTLTVTPTPMTTKMTTIVAATTRGTTGSATATAWPPTAMRNTKAIIKEGAARRVMSEGGIHRQSSRGIPVVPRSPEIPIIMVTPTRMTFPTSPTGTAGTAGTAGATGAGTAGATGAGTADAGMTGASGRRVVSEQQHKQQQNQPQHQLREQQQQQQHQQQQQQQQHQYERQQEQPRQPQHHELQHQQLQQHLQQQHQPQQQQREYPTASSPTAINESSMGIITTAPAAAVSSFSLDTTPSNTVPGPGPASSSNPGSKNPESKSHHPPLSFSFGNGHGHGHHSGTTSKRSSLSSLRTPSSWSCLNLNLGHGHKDGHGHHSTNSGMDNDNSDIIQPPRPSPSPPIALHPNDSYEPVSTLPPRPAPPPPASAAQRSGQPLTPPPPIGTGYELNNHRVPTAPSSPVAIKISATPAETMPEAQIQEQAAAPPVVGQYSSKTMPTRKGNHGYGSRSRSSGSLRRLFQRTSGKEGWI